MSRTTEELLNREIDKQNSKKYAVQNIRRLLLLLTITQDEIKKLEAIGMINKELSNLE